MWWLWRCVLCNVQRTMYIQQNSAEHFVSLNESTTKPSVIIMILKRRTLEMLRMGHPTPGNDSSLNGQLKNTANRRVCLCAELDENAAQLRLMNAARRSIEYLFISLTDHKLYTSSSYYYSLFLFLQENDVLFAIRHIRRILTSSNAIIESIHWNIR